MPDPKKPAASGSDALPEKVAALIAGLLYISESEAPVEMLQWPGASSAGSLQDLIAQKLSVPKERQSVMKPEALLRPIHSMAAPGDPQMMAWAMRWDALLALLGEDGRQVIIVRGEGSPVHFIIASFGKDNPVLLHTTSVETVGGARLPPFRGFSPRITNPVPAGNKKIISSLFIPNEQTTSDRKISVCVPNICKPVRLL